MQAFEYYNNNIPTCGGISTLKYGLEAFPHQMIKDLIYTQPCFLKQPFLLTEEGRITPLSLYGKSPRWITHLGHPCVMPYHTHNM